MFRFLAEAFVVGLFLNILHADEVQVVPNPLQEVIEVPPVVGGDRHAVRDLVNDV